MASVSSGLRCIARLSLPTIKFSRWKGWPRRPRSGRFRVDAAEFPTQRRHQQMHLRREVPVQRANRDVGAVGDGAHLHRLIAAFGRDSHGGVQDALAALRCASDPSSDSASTATFMTARGGASGALLVFVFADDM